MKIILIHADVQPAFRGIEDAEFVLSCIIYVYKKSISSLNVEQTCLTREHRQSCKRDMRWDIRSFIGHVEKVKSVLAFPAETLSLAKNGQKPK